MIQRAEALDDDKLKEKEALTTQAVEKAGLFGGVKQFLAVIFPGVLGDLHRSIRYSSSEALGK